MSEAPPPLPPPLPLPCPAPARPRVWTVLTVAALSLFASLAFAGLVQIIAMFALGDFKGGQMPDPIAATRHIIEQPWGPAALVLPSQLAILIAALSGGLLSPAGLGGRLGYTRSILPWKAFPLLLGGTFFAALLGSFLTESVFKDEGISMRLIADMMRGVHGAGLAVLAFLICVLPPLSEESLFRGYLQRRLLQRWPPIAAIAVSSLFFVAAHFDPHHVLAVVPLAIWLGVVAWRSASLWPSMLCHVAQNSLAFWATRHFDPDANLPAAPQLAALAFFGTLTAGAIVVMRRHPVPAPAELPAQPEGAMRPG